MPYKGLATESLPRYWLVPPKIVLEADYSSAPSFLITQNEKPRASLIQRISIGGTRNVACASLTPKTFSFRRPGSAGGRLIVQETFRARKGRAFTVLHETPVRSLDKSHVELAIFPSKRIVSALNDDVRGYKWENPFELKGISTPSRNTIKRERVHYVFTFHVFVYHN